jgi:hypothetical protein
MGTCEAPIPLLEVGIHKPVAVDDLSGFHLYGLFEHWPVIDAGMELATFTTRVNIWASLHLPECFEAAAYREEGRR